MTSQANGNTVPRAQRGVLQHQGACYGTSELDHPLEIYGPQTAPVDILLMAAMHGDEVETTVVLSEALRRVPDGDIRNPVILGVNPDGILRGTRCNARGVDLNRNWPSRNWSPATVYHRAHGEQSRDIMLSPGEQAASEAETRALLNLVEKLQPKAIVSLHAPLGCIDAPSASRLARWISDEVNLPLVEDVGYATPGSFGTWSSEQGIDIITWELPARSIAANMATHVPVLQQLIAGQFDMGRYG